MPCLLCLVEIILPEKSAVKNAKEAVLRQKFGFFDESAGPIE
jgi:hypothetical protein